MKKIAYLVLLGLAGGTVPTLSQEATGVSVGSQTVKQLAADAVNFRIPQVGVEVERTVLENGLTLYLYEDHHVPIINAQVLVRCGSLYDSPEKSGLSSMVGTVLRSGGSKRVSGDSLNVLLEYLGAVLETDIGMESGAATLSVLAKDFELGFDLLADLLRNPTFPEEKLELAKTEVKNRIKRRNDDLGTVGIRSFRSVVYGSHPYGRIQEWSAVKGITVSDLSDYHARFFAPNNMMIAVSGDFRKEALKEVIKRFFGDWPKASVELPKAQAVSATAKPGVFQVRKETNQTNINIGLLGVKRGNPDIPAIAVMNYVLGGGSFASRITSRVRSDEGLSYRTGSVFETNANELGVFYGYCQTKSATTHKAVSLILDEIKRMAATGATEQEVKEARGSLVNSYAFNFDTAAKIAQSLMSLEYRGLPSDFHLRYVDAVRNVTVADVRAVAKKYLKGDKLSIVVAGDAKSFEKPLTPFGKVTNIELTPPDVN